MPSFTSRLLLASALVAVPATGLVAAPASAQTAAPAVGTAATGLVAKKKPAVVLVYLRTGQSNGSVKRYQIYLRRYAKKKAHATGGHSSVTKALGFSHAYRRLPPRKGSSVKTLPLRGSKKRSSKKRAA